MLALAAPSVRAQVQTDRLEAMMIASGTGPRGEPLTIPLVEERLNVTIDHQMARTTLLQVYRHNNAGQIEGRYQLRPGSGSRVEGFAYWNGEQKIVGEVFERQTARRVYDNVTARRRDPGLLEEDGEGAFAFRVFPINPNEKKRVELTWSKWLDQRGKTIRYRAPLTRGDAEVVVSITGPIKNLRSPTHRIHVEKTSDGVRLRSEGAARGGELVLEWQADELDWTADAFVQAPGKNHDGWFALSLAAPDLPPNAVAAKDVTIVIDRSGSMMGEPLDNAKASAMDVIRRLNPNDRVNVIAFSDEVDPLFKTPQPADAGTRQRAVAFVDRLHEGGGTDIALALGTAISAQDKQSSRPRVVVFMTDGQSDAEKALQATKLDTRDVRLFTLGLGKEVNKPLLSRLAAQKRGRFVYIETASAIRSEVGKLAASISNPLLVDVSIDVEGAQAVRVYPRTLPDLFAQDELLVTGRLRGTGPAKFIFHGKLSGKPVTFTRTVDISKAPARPWVGRLWAQSRVDHLLEEISLGSSAPELMNEVLELALAYNFVTPYTAFLAIPESELAASSERATVEAARERKKKIMADNGDAAALDALESKAGGEVVQVQGTAPTIDPGSYSRNIPTGRTFGSTLGAQNDSYGAEDEDSSSKRSPGQVTSKTRGCAGCASDARGGSMTGLLVLGVLAVLLRRRRR
ncbi:MAG TPA: VIT and VWA domain-containing protein [Kofleriaceae bacterium]|nr:VIT and VWA domain-containing protein [Kofleriaceae bacterium]